MNLDARIWILALGLVSIAATQESAPSGGAPEAYWQSYRLPEQIPPARGNAVADRDDAAALGMKIFFDNRFSKSGAGVSCASCHNPEHSFSELKPRSKTLREVARNAPDLINAAWYTKAHFWDGKVDSLWSAPLFTFEQDDEMGSSRLHVVHVLWSIYKLRYEKIFGAMPDISDPKRFPDSGKPGSIAFDAMADDDKLIVKQIYVNVGKALEAYLRKLAAGRSAFDDFLAGSTEALSPSARRGMKAFESSGCGTCHSGPTFTDEKFYNIGVVAAPGHEGDLGREDGARFFRNWEFSSKQGSAAEPALAIGERNAFRTPSLRNVALTAPYGHDGVFENLDQVIDAHAPILPGHVALAAQDRADLIDFLRSLSGRQPQRPWNYWPGG
jgi:cytochrome c peroxidase